MVVGIGKHCYYDFDMAYSSSRLEIQGYGDFDRVVRTKIVPPKRRSGLLHRPRLVDFLHEHLNKKLILISAAPGYGKTSLLVDFLQDTELPACWYALDASDDDPCTFLEHLVVSVTEKFPQLNTGALSSLSVKQFAGYSAQTVLRVLVNEIQDKIPDYFVIVLDDYQHADGSPQIRELLTWFLDHQPDNCCIILSTRNMPELPFFKIIARQEIAGLGSDDLAFTPEEIQAYLSQNHNLSIPLEEAKQLAIESEGWITGILLSTHTLWKGLLRSMIAAKGKDAQVFGYLAKEVFAQQTDETQRFLKASSILKVMRPTFCDAMLGIRNSAELLEWLENANLFVTRVPSPETAYRYHALFQEFLLAQFEGVSFSERQVLHCSAAELFEQEEAWEEALNHYLAANANPGAIRVLHRIIEPTFGAGRLVTLARWIDSLDQEARASDALLLVMRGRVFVETGDLDRALALYQRAREVYLSANDLPSEAGVRVREAFAHRLQGDYVEAKNLCQEVIALDQEIPIHITSLAEAYRILGECHHLAGQLAEAKRVFRRSLQLYEKAGDLYYTATLLQNLGTTARRMGNPLEAEGHYTRALKILELLDNRLRIAEIKNNIGVGYYYQGEYEQALEILQQALSDAREVGHVRIEALILASLGDVSFDRGDLRETQRLYEASLSGARESRDSFLEVYALIALTNLYRIDQAWEQAHSLLSEADRLCRAADSGYTRGLIELCRGMLCCEENRSEEAISSLKSAINLLRDAGGRRELAKATLWYAHALFRAGNKEEAFSRLWAAIDMCRDLAHSHLLVADGSRMLGLLEEARSIGGADNEMFDDLLLRISQFTLESIHPQMVGRKVTPPRLEIRALGEGTVSINGEPIPHTAWGGPLVKELFFFLLENQRARREVILDIFWPEYSTAKAKSVFHATLYRMRRVLPKGTVGYDSSNEVYFFDLPSDFWYDVAAFKNLMDEVRHGNGDLENLLRQALGIYKGDYLIGIYSDWCLQKREALRRLYLDGLVQQASLFTKRGKLEESMDLYLQVVKNEPFREDIHRELMRSLVLAGRQAEAVQHYLKYAQFLYDEMNVKPTLETTLLYQSLLKKASEMM